MIYNKTAFFSGTFTFFYLFNEITLCLCDNLCSNSMLTLSKLYKMGEI